MATSPNFNWPEPDNTDLVKNGALAIRTAVNAIDTSLVDLKGGTTGQVLKKNSNTDMDFIWGADSAGMTNPMTTTGDTIYSSSGSTPARLGIGSTGQVLTVAGGIPSWATPSASASGLTLVKIQTIGTTVSSVTVSSAFSSTYDNYLITINGGSASTLQDLKLTLGSTTSGYSFAYSFAYYDGSATGKSNGNNTSSWQAYTYESGNTDGQIFLQSPFLSAKTTYQSKSSFGGVNANPGGFLNDTTSYTAFTLTPAGGTLTGGTIRVYGYQNS